MLNLLYHIIPFSFWSSKFNPLTYKGRRRTSVSISAVPSINIVLSPIILGHCMVEKTPTAPIFPQLYAHGNWQVLACWTQVFCELMRSIRQRKQQYLAASGSDGRRQNGGHSGSGRHHRSICCILWCWQQLALWRIAYSNWHVLNQSGEVEAGNDIFWWYTFNVALSGLKVNQMCHLDFGPSPIIFQWWQALSVFLRSREEFVCDQR